jgi:hypothetical protein
MKFIPNTEHVEKVVIENKKIADHYENDWNNISDYINYTPNWLHKDGRINATMPGGEYRVAEVSPYNPLFKTQIESGVWPLVEAFVNKGYLTCSSCEGHGWDLYCRVSLVTPTLDYAQDLVKQLQFGNWKIRIESYRPIYDYESNFKTTIDVLNREELKNKVFTYYNKIFCRKYEEYFFIDLFLPKYLGNFSLWNWIRKTPSDNYKSEMQKMIDRVNNDLTECIY